MRAYYKSPKGFSLIELIIVIALMAIIAMIAAVSYISIVKFTRVKTDVNSAANITKAVRTWYTFKSEDTVTGDEFQDFVDENLYLKTMKLAELKEYGLASFTDTEYVPNSLMDEAENQVAGQDFYVGMIGKGLNAKFIITIETESNRLGNLTDSTVADYDGNSVGVVYVEP